ncbi:MAG: ABC transporter ATP-binding protein [Beijerinckiaceae bacterium]
MAAIELQRVSKHFGLVEAVSDLSLEIASGEFAVFLGPSGCGKTTLLRMIAGLEDVTSGEIRIGGERVDQLAPGQRGVAMVFQHYALYPHMSVHDNMAFGLKNIGVAREEIGRKVTAAAKMLEIEPLLLRKPTQLSGGQKQRVAIGRAIVKEPKAFLFDEPLSNLDAALRSRTRIELARLHQQVKSTMIFVTHDQVEAMTLASRIIVMNKGKVEQVGSPMEVYRRPATKFVATFVGTPAMNVLPATMSDGGAKGMAMVTLRDGSKVATAVPASALSGAREVEIGIRAEHVSGKGEIPAKVEVIERLGDRALVYARLGDGATVTYEEAGDVDLAIGAPVKLSFARERIHLFDAQGRAHHAA